MPSEPRYLIEDEESALSDKYRLVLDEVGSDCDVLELGCYDGSFSRYLSARQNRVIGVDYDADAVLKAADVCTAAYRFDLNKPGELFNGPLQGRCFDRVLMMDVLEHLVAPENLLKHVLSRLKPEGFVIVTLPNIAFWGIRKMLLNGVFRYGDVGILDRSHFRFYTFQTARELLEGTAYHIEQWKPLSYQAPLVGRLGLRNFSLTGAVVNSWEHKLAVRYPNFYCMQFYFKLTPAR
ncbi:class I SAM-dependent methyltransferase [Geobacter pickeringii]|uniref:class I SAM-dependent methyltransferase n=1 Tax=Geobacter pickeringii TaxID=345632 RepID=UPI00068EA7B6|nr:class I SAM-dependent methyltransferase [Geobacter pickeringii]